MLTGNAIKQTAVRVIILNRNYYLLKRFAGWNAGPVVVALFPATVTANEQSHIHWHNSKIPHFGVLYS